jgi:hypothetical protein
MQFTLLAMAVSTVLSDFPISFAQSHHACAVDRQVKAADA